MDLQLLCLQAVILLAIGAYGALTPRTASLLRGYFLTQVGYVVVLFGAQMFVGLESKTFAVLYAVMTLAMLGWVFALSTSCILCHDHPIKIFVTGLAFGILPAWFSIYERWPHSLAGWIYVLESSVLFGFGLVSGLCAPYMHWANRKVYLTLAVMWIVLGVFRQGFRLHVESKTWLDMNLWFPWAVTCLGMGYSATLMRYHSQYLAEHRASNPHQSDNQHQPHRP